MAKILVRVKNNRNQKLLENHIGKGYKLSPNHQKISELSFDLAIFCDEVYRKLEQQIAREKEAERPVFLPVLLLASPKKEASANKFLTGPADDLIFKPVKKVELGARIDTLLKARELSWARKNSILDPLTGCYNRRYLGEVLDKEVKRSERYGHPFTLMMIDVNNFKQVNDLHSHMKGDEVLKTISEIIQKNIRDPDTLIRYGGDEFLVLLPETGEGKSKVSERLKRKVTEWSREAEDLRCELSLAIGCADWHPGDDKTAEEVLKEADRRMYKDK